MSALQNSLLHHLRSLAAKQANGALPDRQLLEAFLTQRSEAAFAALVRRHGPMVLSVCRRVLGNHHDAEDAFQAVFLIFARKAERIRKQDSVSSFLHGVAYHVAANLRLSATRRAARERRQARPPCDDPCDDLTWRELRSVLDEELAKLPEQCRTPLVLCYLEGKTQDEAVRLLGWSKSTFRRRLEQGRDTLGRRLTRRGVTLSAALSAPLLADAEAKAALSPLLIASTVRAGLASATGQTTGALISTQVASLVQCGVGSLLTKKASIAVVLLVSLILGIGGLLAHRAVPSGVRTEAPAAPPPQSSPARRDSKGHANDIKGRVLDPDGKPLAGATVYFVPKAARRKADLKLRAVTDEAGSFRLSPALADMQGGARLLATAAGHGPDWADVKKDAETTLRLVKDDVPIRGRVIDLEGQPIVDVTVVADLLAKPVQGDLTPWLNDQIKKGRDWRNPEVPMKLLWPALLGEQYTAKTDTAGRFQISGFGCERLVIFKVSGPSIESNSHVRVLTRSDKANGWATHYDHDRIYAASFDYAVGPCKPIVGTVRDKATGKPLPGIHVKCYSGGTIGSFKGMGYAVTDEKGRYRLSGVSKAREYTLAAAALPYFNVTKWQIADTPGLEPITVDVELMAGIPLNVRLIDKATGKPVRGSVSYLARAENPHLKDYPGFGKGLSFSPIPYSEPREDAPHTVLAIPGPGFLCVKADEADRYIGFELKDWDGFLLRAVPDGLHPSQFHAVVPIDIKESDKNSRDIIIALEPGRTRTGTVVGPDGQPLAGVHVAGLTPLPHFFHGYDPRQRFQSKRLSTANFTVLGLNPRKARNIVFFHSEKKLGKVQAVRGDEAGPLTVRLEALGGVTGRVVDAKGRPWAGLTVEVSLTRLIAAYKDLPWELLDNLGPMMEVKTTTDREGKFRIDGLLPGLQYNLALSVGEIKPGSTIAAYRENVTVEVGKTKDVGDIKSALQSEPRP